MEMFACPPASRTSARVRPPASACEPSRKWALLLSRYFFWLGLGIGLMGLWFFFNDGANSIHCLFMCVGGVGVIMGFFADDVVQVDMKTKDRLNDDVS